MKVLLKIDKDLMKKLKQIHIKSKFLFKFKIKIDKKNLKENDEILKIF